MTAALFVDDRSLRRWVSSAENVTVSLMQNDSRLNTETKHLFDNVQQNRPVSDSSAGYTAAQLISVQPMSGEWPKPIVNT